MHDSCALRSVPWLEDSVSAEEQTDDEAEPWYSVRRFTGWFSDMSTVLSGFRVIGVGSTSGFDRSVLSFPKLMRDQSYRTNQLGEIDLSNPTRGCTDEDAGFVTMAFGFSVFFLCIAVAPPTCLGVWISLPVITGTLHWHEARDFLLIYYIALWDQFVLSLDCLTHWNCDFDWPEWFNIEALIEFFDDPMPFIYRSVDYLLSLQFYMKFDIDYLLQGGRELLKLNSVLAALKPVATQALKLWFFLSKICEEKRFSSSLHLILFSDCVPSRKDLKLAAMLSKLRRDRNKHPIKELKQKYTVHQLKIGSFTAKELKEVFSLLELKEAGYDCGQLKEAEFTAAQLSQEGFDKDQLKAAGYSANEMKEARFSAEDLKAAGYEATDLKSAGFTALLLKKAGFEVQALRQANFTAGQLKQAEFGAKALKDTGYSLSELRVAGYTATEIKTAGFDATEMKGAGFLATDLRKAGFRPAELKTAHFKAPDMKSAGFTVNDLKSAGYSLTEMHQAGFFEQHLKEAGFTAKEMREIGCEARALKTAGYNNRELQDAGFNAMELKAAGFSLSQLKGAGFNASQLKEAGFTANDLMNDGLFTVTQLKNAGFRLAELEVRTDQLAQVADAEMNVNDLIQSEQVTLEVIRTAKRNVGRSLNPTSWVSGKEVYIWTNQDLKNAGVSAPWICQKSANGEHRIPNGDTVCMYCHTATALDARDKDTAAVTSL